MLRIEIFSERKDQLGEGPLWDVQEQPLYWTVAYGPAGHRADLKCGDRKSWAPAAAPSWCPALDGRMGSEIVAAQCGALAPKT